MADFSFSEDAELLKLNALVLEDPEEFENWEKLVRAAESQEGGIHRNSSPGAIASTRDVYDRFLARFPLFFGYWKKYADLEFSIAGTEAAEMVYERGVASIGISVDLWANYCGFKVETSHDADVIRELFERGADSVGLDFLSHPFWDKYLEFEERLEAQDRIFAILSRTIDIPMHQYARYFERYRAMATNRSIDELASPDEFNGLRQEVMSQGGSKQKSERDLEQELRSKLDSLHLEKFQHTQTETTKRWIYEQEVKRPYYHVTELDDAQLANWRKYLDFEEAEPDNYIRTKFLYERCLVTAANYDEFWLRYARWLSAQPSKQEEVRNVYQRASCIFVPISRPMVRLFYAQFEESENRSEVAEGIYDAILMNLPDHVESIISLVNVHRRQHGLESAIGTLKSYINDANSTIYTRGALVSEWARLVWKVKGDAEEARQIYINHQSQYLDSQNFWTSWLEFEMQQPTSQKTEATAYERVRSVFDNIRNQSRLPPPLIRDLSSVYFAFLKERGGKDAMKEFMQLDRELNGPPSVMSITKAPTTEIMQDVTMQQRMVVENGYPVGQQAQEMTGVHSHATFQAQQPVNGGQIVQ